jgi:hypothetical protein
MRHIALPLRYRLRKWKWKTEYVGDHYMPVGQQLDKVSMRANSTAAMM